MKNQIHISERVASIDIVRGFDLLLIIFADHFFISLHKGAGNGFTGFLVNQFDHPEWFGSAFYDIIMPLFLFIVGAVIPFSLGCRMLKNNNKTAIGSLSNVLSFYLYWTGLYREIY